MGKEKSESNGFWKVLANADALDVALMAVGLLGSIGDGLAFPAVMVVKSRLINAVGATIHNGFTDPHLFLRSLNQNALLMMNIAVATMFFCFLEGYCWTRTAERQAARMRSKYLKAVLRQDVSYFDTGLVNVSEVVTSVSNDTLIIQECISEKVPNFLTNLSSFIGCYTAAFYLLWRLAIVAVPFLVLLVVPGIVYGRVLISLARKMRSEYIKAGSIAEQAISSIRTVYAFVGEYKTVSAFSEALQGSVKLGLKQGLAKGLALGSNGITFAVWSFTTWYATKLIMYYGAKGGAAFAAGVCLNVGGQYLGSSLSNLKYFSEAYAAGERIREMINRVPSIDSDDMDGDTLENITGEVEFKDVVFAYPSRHETLILRGFSLKVPAGKTVALVGKSGSGKSTVISLLQRFYNPVRGEIFLDGVAIDKLQLKWLRSQMGLVSQEPALFAMSIKENIMFGKEDASMEDIIEASKAANAHQFISEMPHGYDTQVGERGVQISGGQKQRIAIARAIIRKPRIVLLDEATSALDSESELVVQEALDRVSKGTTTIVIAHRLSTIRHADVISVVDEGRVMETGSHDDLICLPTSLYSSLQQQQTETNMSVDNGIQQKQVHRKHTNQSTINDLQKLETIDESNKSELPAKTKKTKKPSFRRLVALNLPEWKTGMLGCISAALFGAIQPLYALTMGAMIAVFFLPSHEEIKRKIRIFSPCFAALAVFAFATNVTQHYSFAYIGEMLTLRVRTKMLEKMLSFEVGWYDRDENSNGAICSRLANDANAVRSLVGDRTSVLVQAFSVILISTTMGLIISWRLAAVMILMQPLIIFCLYTRRVLLRNMARKSEKYQEKTSNLACEAVINIRTITSFSSQERILQMLEETQVVPRKQNIRQSWYTGIGLAASQTITILFTALNFWYGGKLILHGYMNSRQLFQTIMILERTGRFVADVGSMMTDLARGADAVESVFSILDRVSYIEPCNPKGQQPNEIRGDIEIQNVEFAYPSRPSVIVFKEFSIDIQAGTSTALVGQSGSGKSTIIGLIERFYDPLQGAVKIDGQDIRTYNLRSLRKHMALVSQEPALFAGSIRENIVYGVSKDVDESEVVEAAKAANAHDFISSLKDGYETWCGDKGTQLSGGQKQRIAIARAMLKNPRILLLDEATSALDTQSERVVQEALEKTMIGRTSVVVAHRLTTIQNCDIIAVLDKGKIVETGSHASLLAKGSCGAYYSLVSLQTSSPTM